MCTFLALGWSMKPQRTAALLTSGMLPITMINALARINMYCAMRGSFLLLFWLGGLFLRFQLINEILERWPISLG